MKRFHVHLHVANLADSIAFYTKLFAAEPSRREEDYAKWMLEDRRLNFAISTRGAAPGIDHLGFQAADADELSELKERAAAADQTRVVDEGETTCCYAQGVKHWVTDPQGIAWEHFHTLRDVPTFGEPKMESQNTATSACCAPRMGGKAIDIPVVGANRSSSCC